MNNDNNLFETDNLGISAYLALSGLSYVKSVVRQGRNLKQKVVMQFDDPGGIGSSLAQEFVTSKEKKYRDFLFYFRSQIQETLDRNKPLRGN